MMPLISSVVSARGMGLSTMAPTPVAGSTSADAPVHALYQRNRYMAPRVRALLDFLINRFAEESSNLMD